MNDLNDLKDAMHSTPGFEPGPLDLDLVMDAGGRLRRRRRLAVGAASGLAVLVLLVGGAQLARPGEPSPGLGVAGPPPSSSSSSTVVVEDPVEPDPGKVLGDVVKTGMKADGLDRVLWIQQVTEPVLPDVGIGMVAGRRAADGELLTDVVTNETEGSDRSPGFHGLEMAMGIDGRPTPAFGYYVGAAAKITVVADGRTVRAQQATWSEDASVVLFWFDLKKVKPTSDVGKATAYDKNNRKLPAGHSGFAVG